MAAAKDVAGRVSERVIESRRKSVPPVLYLSNPTTIRYSTLEKRVGITLSKFADDFYHKNTKHFQIFKDKLKTPQRLCRWAVFNHD